MKTNNAEQHGDVTGEPDEPAKVPVRRLLALAAPEWRRLAAATVFLVVGGAAGLAWPQVVRVLIDAAVAGGAETLNRAVLAMAVIFAVQGVAVAFRYYLFSVAGERIVTRLRESVFAAVIEQEIGFFDQRKTGELTSRLTSDATVVQNTVSVNLSMGLRNLVMLVGGLTLLVASSPRLTLLMLALVPPVAVGAVVVGRRMSKIAREAQDALAR
ncbi:MAG: ABC transporter transmembrane domain-containing protein, partial [Candidatus Sulfomarinibacteraceae bacterium]